MKLFIQPLTILFLAIVAPSICTAQAFDGYALYNAQGSNTAYLIDADGDIAHSWSCDEEANYAIALLENGNIMRGAVYQGNDINGAAVGGMVQELDADGDVVWEFIYSTSTVVAHHDLCAMPNGNVLLIAWEYVGTAELDDLGYTGNGAKYSTHIIEVAQNGTGGEIVWEWHIKDHFVQDEDANLDNYGVISEHPELLDVNVSTDSGGPGGGGGASDWFHANGLDYDPIRDQIVFSSRFLNEVFIIDHSTTTAEAASHSGGNSGKGGDFLYRWGHPTNYGVSGDQIIEAAVHDARWILPGRPNAGYVQIFNNEGNNGASTIDAFNPPLAADGYNYEHTPGMAYEPTSYDWRHECIDDASGQSASDRMSNGNVFVNLSGGMGGGGFMYEADENDNIVFQYGANTQKGFRYECDYEGIQNLLDNPCESPDNIGEQTELASNIFPNPSTGQFTLIGAFPMSGVDQIVVHDMFGKEVHRVRNAATLDLSHMADGVYFVTMSYEGKYNTRMVTVAK